jgi:hypothetical protein
MKLLLFITLFLSSFIPSKAQHFQGALRFSYAKTMFDFKGPTPNNSYRLEEQFAPGLGALVHMRIDTSWELTSGLGLQFRRFRLIHETIDFPSLTKGTTYIRSRFGAVEIPVLIGYKFYPGKKIGVVISAGGILSQSRLNATAIGYDELTYEGADSLFFNIHGGGSFVRRYSVDPFVSIGINKYSEGRKHFGFSIFYQYTPVPITQISFDDEFRNSATTANFSTSFKGNLSVAGIAFTYYPYWLSFRKVESDDEEEE